MGKLEISKKDLINLYEKKKLTTFQIADKLGCCQTTVWKKLKSFRIKPRSPGVERVNISKTILENLYVKDKLSSWKIEKKLKIPRSTIHRKLREYGIETRDLATANVIYPKNDFSGDLIEKAYLIGFTIGDLRVRKQYKNSKTICLACSSTIPEQIELIKELFNKYGRVWIKKSKDGKLIHSEVFVNESFNFLFSKELSKWISNSRKYFFSFLAGFIDAEGHIGIYNNMAKFSLGNYDSDILLIIYQKLNRFGVICNKPLSDKRKGKFNSQGYKYKKNYWHFKIHNKTELIKFFNAIKPYIKHKNKIKSLNIAVDNINMRNKFKIKKMKETFYITTTIPYANASPHIGFALEIVQADVLARWNRLLGKDVFFLTGTDEHGVKNYQTAKKEGLSTQKFVDKNSAEFKKLTKALNISNDYFIRTTNKKVHWPGVLKIWEKLKENNDIYKKKYIGNYCTGCERFITEKELENGKCSIHPNLKIERISEINYFFRLSKYSDKIKKLIEEDKLKITPLKWKNDFLTLIKDGLTDVSFSREKNHLPWGVPVPGDEIQIMYVWPDALTNYLTGIGFPNKKYEKYWPANIHVVGKDMLRFHTGIWPGMLLSAGLPLPKEVIVHGFLTAEGRKMSKSLGNVISPKILVEKYGADSVRYFCLRHFPFGEDGDFSEKALVARHNNELANKFGNLVSRTSALAEKYGLKEVNFEKIDVDIHISNVVKHVSKLIEEFEFDKALNSIFAFIDTLNQWVQDGKIWETGNKKDLFELATGIKTTSILLWPFIPETCEKISKTFGFKISLDEIEKPLKVIKVKKSKILFKKI